MAESSGAGAAQQLLLQLMARYPGGGFWVNEAMNILNGAGHRSAAPQIVRQMAPLARALVLVFGFASAGLAFAQQDHAAEHMTSHAVTQPDTAVPAADAVAPLAPREAAEAMRNWQMRSGEQLKRNFGVEVLGVRLASHDWMINFRYKVLDPAKAKPLLDRKVVPYLVDEVSGARLAVPAMENIGELRQVTAAEAGRQYFLTFGNGNQIVRHGSRVDVVIGGFHAEGMIVE